MAPDTPTADWTAERFFSLLRTLGRLRVISVCGPSVFEAICRVGPFEKTGGFVNIITDAYHWHFAASRLGHLRASDALHARSGRRVLFFELREDEGNEPFLRVYLFRPHGDEFDPKALEGFEAVLPELKDGVALAPGRHDR